MTSPSTPGHENVRRLVAAALLALCIAAAAQAQDKGLRISQYAHEVWTSEEGLPQNSVADLTQTHDGYIWLGTQGGLSRFDGVNFTTYTRRDGLPSDEVSVLMEDSNGTLWIGTSGNGLARLVNGKIETFEAGAALGSGLVRSLYEDQQGNIWIGTIDGGLHRYDGTSIKPFGPEQGLVGSVAQSMYQTADGRLWVGTNEALNVLDNGQFTSYTNEDGLPGDVVWTIHEDPSGVLWFGTSGGLVHLSDDTFVTLTTADGLCGDNVSTLATDPSGALWIGTLGGSLCRLAGGRFDHFGVQDGLPNDRVRKIYVDSEENIWVGTARGGLNQFRIAKFTHVSVAEGLSHRVVFSVMEVAPGVIAAGTEGGGLSLIRGSNVQNVTTETGLTSDDVYAIETDRHGRIWVGTYGGGVCRLSGPDAVSPEQCYSTADGLPSNNVYSLEEDRAGRIWVGSRSGVVTIEDDVVVNPDIGRALSDVPVMGIQEDIRGDLWMASYGSGIFRIRGRQVLNITTAHGLDENIILTLHESRDGTMWAGIQNGGLCRLDDAEARCTSATEGMPTDVLQILEDAEDRFWLGSMNGVYRVEISDVEALLDGRATSIPTEHFGRADGLRVDDMNGGSQPSAWQAGDGRLWFATSEGVAVIDPRQMRTNDVAPQVLVDCVHVNDVHLPASTSMTLQPGSRDIAFFYTGLSFTASQNVRFQYRLEGYDDDWIEAGERREAYYTNLPPGTYRFVVKAANNDGVWNEEGAAITLDIQPYFWQTWWFFALCWLVLVGLGFMVHRMRIRKLREHERNLAKQVEERTCDLRREKDRVEEAKRVIEGQAEQLRDLNDHLETKVQHQFELLVEERKRYEADLIEAKERAEASDRLKTAILQNLNHEFRTPLTAILGFAEIIGAEGKDELNGFAREIRNGGQRLMRTLDALLEFSRLESDDASGPKTAVDLAFSAALVVRRFEEKAAEKSLELSFDELNQAPALIDSSAFEQVIWNLVDNAIKFTNAGEVTVTAGVENDRAFVRVRDTGIGIGDAFVGEMYDAFTQESHGYNRTFEGVGLGLTITQRLVDQMGGDVAVETESGVGTTFTVLFPVADMPVES